MWKERSPTKSWRAARDRQRHSCTAASFAVRGSLATILCCLLVIALSLTTVTNAFDLPDEGVSLGSWTDATSRYFGGSSEFALAGNTQETVVAPPLRVLALVDWQSERRTEFLSTWPNQSSLTLWANRDLASSLVSRTRAAALIYRPIWSTEAFPTQGGNPSPSPYVVSAVGADLLGRGDADVLLQASDGNLYALNHSSVSTWTPSSAFEPISIVADGAPLATASSAVTTTLKQPTAPSTSVVHDFLSSNATSDAATVGVAFVNSKDQLVLLSHVVSGASWPPQYIPRVLADERSAETGRAILPLSIIAADVNEDCAAELLYAVRDSRQRRYEVHLVTTTATTADSAAVLLQLSEGDGESYGDSFTLADLNGDGLPELVIAVQLANQTSKPSCAPADRSTTETCTAYHAVRIFYPTRGADVSGSPRCRTAAEPVDHHLSYNLNNSELFVLTPAWCGVEDWTDSAAGTLPLYMPNFPSAPLLLRPGDYNRDRLVDIVVPSSYGPLLFTSRTVNGASPLVCSALDSATGKAAVQKAATQRTSSATRLDAYRTATPFFATLALLGRLEVVLTHHRRFPSASAATTTAGNQIQVYQNSEVPSRSYFLSATALTLKSYGAGCIGATHHMTWQDINMRSHWATVTQQGQTQGHALLPPYVLVGLDETFSYVHDYTIGLRVAADETTEVQAKEWPSYLVPNSQVFAEVFPVQKPSKWHLQLYLPTSTYRLLLVVALTVALVVIGLPVIWLRCGEMKQDYNEWRVP